MSKLGNIFVRAIDSTIPITVLCMFGIFLLGAVSSYQMRIDTDFVHAMVHDGNYYSVQQVDTDFDAGDALTFVVNTGSAAGDVHWVLYAQSTGLANCVVYKGGAYTAGTGTTLTGSNHNLKSSNTATAIIVNGPTITALGTEQVGLKEVFGSAAAGPFATGGRTRADVEIVQGVGSQAIINCTSQADNSFGVMSLSWYETNQYIPQ